MTNITIGAVSRRWNLGFVTDTARALREALQEGSRRRREVRTIEVELRQYSRSEIIELGVSCADVRHIAKEATEHHREEEFRAALDDYIAGYMRPRAVA